jgi:hypothetical protein
VRSISIGSNPANFLTFFKQQGSYNNTQQQYGHDGTNKTFAAGRQQHALPYENASSFSLSSTPSSSTMQMLCKLCFYGFFI